MNPTVSPNIRHVKLSSNCSVENVETLNMQLALTIFTENVGG